MPQTAIDFCSQALIKCHATAIQSFDEETAEATVAGNLYATARDALLVSYPWNFSTAGASLARLAATPETEFAYAFALPDKFMHAIGAGATAARPRGLDYEIHENRLHCDSETVYLKYHFRPDESLFPPHFVTALVASLCAEFSGPLGGNQSMVNDFTVLAERRIREARNIDARQDRPNRVEDFALVECRY